MSMFQQHESASAAAHYRIVSSFRRERGVRYEYMASANAGRLGANRLHVRSDKFKDDNLEKLL